MRYSHLLFILYKEIIGYIHHMYISSLLNALIHQLYNYIAYKFIFEIYIFILYSLFDAFSIIQLLFFKFI